MVERFLELSRKSLSLMYAYILLVLSLSAVLLFALPDFLDIIAGSRAIGIPHHHEVSATLAGIACAAGLGSMYVGAVKVGRAHEELANCWSRK